MFTLLLHASIYHLPRLDAWWVESGKTMAIDMGNERVRGERAVIEADKVRNWLRGATVSNVSFIGHLDDAKGK
jgi:hypothetical protein